MKIETRTMEGVQLRASQEGKRKILRGMAAVFNSPSEDIGGFVEVVESGAFAEVLQSNPDVLLNVGHDDSKLLARTTNGSLRLQETSEGLVFEAELPNTPTAAEAWELVKTGILKHCSFAFIVGKDDWSETGGKRIRFIEKVKSLIDVTLATRPAYAATNVSAEARNHAKALQNVTHPPMNQGGQKPMKINIRGLASAYRFKHISKNEIRSLNVEVGEEGGFLVPSETANELIQLFTESSIVRPRAKIFKSNPKNPDASLSVPAIKCGNLGEIGGITAAWVPDGDEIPATADPTFSEITLQPHSLACFFMVSDKLLRNSEADDYFNQLAADSMAYFEDLHFLSGNGVGQPYGIIGHPGTIEMARIGAGIVGADCTNMLRRLMPASYNLAEWFASPSAMANLLNTADVNGNPLVKCEGDGFYMLGRRLTVTNRLQELGTPGDLILADFSRYAIKDGFGVEVAASAHQTNGFFENLSLVRVTSNFDGQPLVNEPLRLRDGVTVSPFVVLT